MKFNQNQAGIKLRIPPPETWETQIS